MNNRISEVSYNNFGSEMIVVGYRGAKDIDVSFPEYDCIVEHTQYSNFKRGLVKCPYERRVFGVGYLGEGKYKAKVNGEKTKAYIAWSSMLDRCYNSKYHETHPTYIDCTVCPEWHNFQVFAEWFEQNYYEVEDEHMNLDKDILVKGNKVYSPDTCTFVPQSINKIFIKSEASRGSLPIGVSYNKQNRKYSARCNCYGRLRFLGYYSNPQEAFLRYKSYKESYIQQVADEFLYIIPENLYEAMVNYEVEEND